MKNKRFYPQWIIARLDVFVGRAKAKGIDLDAIERKIREEKRFSIVSFFFDAETREAVFRLAPVFFSVYITPPVYYFFITLACWPLFKETVWVHNVPPWKRKVIRKYFKGVLVRFIPRAYSPFLVDHAIRFSRCKRFVIWGVGELPDYTRYAIKHNIDITRIEDGFFRSIGLGVNRALPYSLVFDNKGMHFDPSRRSSLEEILSSHDFAVAPDLLVRASNCISKINEFGLSKYNNSNSTSDEVPKKSAGKKRILVLGQVEDDMSVLYGSASVKSNATLLEAAIHENPEAEIFYRPHPDVFTNRRPELSNVDRLLAKINYVIPSDISLQNSFCDIDRVYTMTSLAGFEALLRGIPVTVMGAPFYSGWGLTDDRQILLRRQRKLSLEEVFAGAYLLYAKYRDPETGVAMELEDVIDKFVDLKVNAATLAAPVYSAFVDSPYFNLKTRKGVLGRVFTGNDTSCIALIADSVNVMRDAVDLGLQGKKVSVFFLREVVANNPNLNIPPLLKGQISVHSLAKRYGSAFSDVERSAVKIGNTISEAFELALKSFIPDGIEGGQLSAGLDDFIYTDSVRFSAIHEVLAEHDLVFMCCDLNNVTASAFYASVFYSRMLGKESSVYFNKNSVDFLGRLDKTEPKVIDENLLPRKITQEFSRLLLEMLEVFRGINKDARKYGVICGSVARGNYAYSPTAFHMVNYLAEQFPEINLLYVPTALGNISAFEEDKGRIFQNGIGANVAVYPQYSEYYSKVLGDRLEHLQEISGKIIGFVIRKQLDLMLPRLVVDGIAPRFTHFSKTFAANLAFTADMTARSENMLFFGTTMDRSPWSRIVNAIALSRGIPTFGLQPQIMSTSRRYKAPVVARFGAIDSAQVDIFRSLGRNEGIEVVGSVNLLARLQSIASFMDSKEKEEICRKTIIFMMQHSNAKQMLMIASSLADTCRANDYRLIVKPHPHQERQVLDQIRGVLEDLKFAEILDPSDNTYKALVRSDIVVGLYSSTLYEAALSGFDVVIANFAKPLDESIDFSRFGIAVKVTQTSEFEGVIKDIAEGGDISKRLKIGRGDYISNNPQFKPPFDFSFIDNFVYSSISVAVCASAREVI